MENRPFTEDFPNKTSIYNGFSILSQHPPVGSGGSENTATKDIRKSKTARASVAGLSAKQDG
jgi:hypothetical protein